MIYISARSMNDECPCAFWHLSCDRLTLFIIIRTTVYLPVYYDVKLVSTCIEP